jgi:cell division protein ZapA
MGEIVVTVNGRAFPLNCADGEEPRIRRLAQYVDGKIGDFVKTHGQIGEARLMLLAALVIADELSDTSQLVQQERSRSTRGDGGGAAENGSRATAAGIRSLAQRIESIAARLESS